MEIQMSSVWCSMSNFQKMRHAAKDRQRWHALKIGAKVISAQSRPGTSCAVIHGKRCPPEAVLLVRHILVGSCGWCLTDWYMIHRSQDPASSLDLVSDREIRTFPSLVRAERNKDMPALPLAPTMLSLDYYPDLPLSARTGGSSVTIFHTSTWKWKLVTWSAIAGIDHPRSTFNRVYKKRIPVGAPIIRAVSNCHPDEIKVFL